MHADSRPPLLLRILALVYFFSLMAAASSYGEPFPLLGRLYTGNSAQAIVLADAVLSLYLCIGILKRQRLTLWLLIAYNLFDAGNALFNLALPPSEGWARLSGAAAPPAPPLLETLVPVLFLMLLNLYLLANRRLFNNRSPYLF